MAHHSERIENGFHAPLLRSASLSGLSCIWLASGPAALPVQCCLKQYSVVTHINRHHNLQHLPVLAPTASRFYRIEDISGTQLIDRIVTSILARIFALGLMPW